MTTIWFESRAYKPPLTDLEHATMDDLKEEYRYVCEELKDRFENVCYSDLQAELEWYQSMNDYMQRLKRIHHEYGTRRHIAEEMRKKYEQKTEK